MTERELAAILYKAYDRDKKLSLKEILEYFDSVPEAFKESYLEDARRWLKDAGKH